MIVKTVRMGWFNILLFTFCVIVQVHNGKASAYKRITFASANTLKDYECAKGQEYWCQNITTAVSCSSFKHCLQSVWEREKPIEHDKSEVCDVCLDMVKQARDQLRSNETQEDLKAVLVGTCNLMPIKPVRKLCDKLMDEFAVEIVDTLSSQMDPEVVCSVAGLCNNPKIHQLEREYNEKKDEGRNKKLNCNSCRGLLSMAETRLENLSPENIPTLFVEMCRSTASFSDGCAAILTKHSAEIYSLLKEYIRPKPVCSLAGVCKEIYHNHNKTLLHQSLNNPSVSVVSMNYEGDLPCELCTELIAHLKDILIANTTEEEFKIILKGICFQMKVYKDECVSLVDEYYQPFYDFLIRELDGQGLCKDIGICSNGANNKQLLRPLLPVDFEIEEKGNKPELAQLPLERMNPLTVIPSSMMNSANKKDKTLCAMCEYVLHFVQQEITLPSNEKKIREFVMKVCDRLPKTVTEECDSFVRTYMDAFIALLANRIDPSQVCPNIGVCPGADFIVMQYGDKPTCPLCLLAMDELNHKIKNNTVEGINDVLSDLCLRDVFPNTLSIECVQFINKHRRAIVDMSLAEFTSQESCVFLDLCVAPDLKFKSEVPIGDVETNEISELSDEKINHQNTKFCALCEFAISKLDTELKDKKTQDEIKEEVDKICSHLPKTLSAECMQFVKEYGDLIMELLVQELEPKEICTLINLCGKPAVMMQGVMKKCLLCELMMDGLRTVLTDRDVDEDINESLERACAYIPKAEKNLCLSLIDELAPQFETALRTLPVGPLICKRIHLCQNRDEEDESQSLGGMNCLIGSSYWCKSTSTAAACRKIYFCQQNVWKGIKPKKSHNKGRIIIID